MTKDEAKEIEEIFKKFGLGSEEEREKFFSLSQEDEEINVNRLGLFTYS